MKQQKQKLMPEQWWLERSNKMKYILEFGLERMCHGSVDYGWSNGVLLVLQTSHVFACKYLNKFALHTKFVSQYSVVKSCY